MNFSQKKSGVLDFNWRRCSYLCANRRANAGFYNPKEEEAVAEGGLLPASLRKKGSDSDAAVIEVSRAAHPEGAARVLEQRGDSQRDRQGGVGLLLVIVFFGLVLVGARLARGVAKPARD